MELEEYKKTLRILAKNSDEPFKIAIETVLQALDNSVSKDKIKEILKYYAYTPADDPDTTTAFYADIKKLLEDK